MLMKNKYFKRGGVSSEVEPDAKMDYWPVETDQYEQTEYWKKEFFYYIHLIHAYVEPSMTK